MNGRTAKRLRKEATAQLKEHTMSGMLAPRLYRMLKKNYQPGKPIPNLKKQVVDEYNAAAEAGVPVSRFRARGQKSLVSSH